MHYIPFFVFFLEKVCPLPAGEDCQNDAGDCQDYDVNIEHESLVDLPMLVDNDSDSKEDSTTGQEAEEWEDVENFKILNIVKLGFKCIETKKFAEHDIFELVCN